MACPRAAACGLSSVIRSRPALILWQREYCDQDRRFPECQRFRLCEHGEPLPVGLLPNGTVLDRWIRAS